MNTVILIGRLTKDPELRYSPQSQKAIGTFSIAVDRPFSDKQTDFFEVVTFGKQAENIANYLSKGRQVAIKGSVQNNNYTDKSGQKRYGTKIVADNVRFLGTKDKNDPLDYKELENEDVPF